jgi:predicted anti-sigma-YlaC factor YlaD
MESGISEMQHLQCQDIEALVDDYVEGELAPGLALRVKEHLCSCQSCRELVDDVSAIVEVARMLDSRRVVPSDVSRRLRAHLESEVGYTPRLRLVKS